MMVKKFGIAVFTWRPRETALLDLDLSGIRFGDDAEVIYMQPGSYSGYDPLTQMGSIGVKGTAALSFWRWFYMSLRERRWLK